jgi:hypothetical protein
VVDEVGSGLAGKRATAIVKPIDVKREAGVDYPIGQQHIVQPTEEDSNSSLEFGSSSSGGGFPRSVIGAQTSSNPYSPGDSASSDGVLQYYQYGYLDGYRYLRSRFGSFGTLGSSQQQQQLFSGFTGANAHFAPTTSGAGATNYPQLSAAAFQILYQNPANGAVSATHFPGAPFL